MATAAEFHEAARVAEQARVNALAERDAIRRRSQLIRGRLDALVAAFGGVDALGEDVLAALAEHVIAEMLEQQAINDLNESAFELRQLGTDLRRYAREESERAED